MRYILFVNLAIWIVCCLFIFETFINVLECLILLFKYFFLLFWGLITKEVCQVLDMQLIEAFDNLKK